MEKVMSGLGREEGDAWIGWGKLAGNWEMRVYRASVRSIGSKSERRSKHAHAASGKENWGAVHGERLTVCACRL